MLLWICAWLAASPAQASELKAETAGAFDKYIAATEARMDEDTENGQFLFIDGLPEGRRREAYKQLQRGEIYVEALHSQEDHQKIHVPSGMIHHWVAVVFIPGANVDQAVNVLQDYNSHQEIYKPQVRQSKLIEKNGDKTKIFLQFFNTQGATVVLDANFDVTDTQFNSTEHQIVSRSTRIAELENAGKPDEHELPVGKDHGYMWRLYSYWRIEQKDGGVYVQNESIALTRTISILVAWLVGPLVKSIPRNFLIHLLTQTRSAVLKLESPGQKTSMKKLERDSLSFESIFTHGGEKKIGDTKWDESHSERCVPSPGQCVLSPADFWRVRMGFLTAPAGS